MPAGRSGRRELKAELEPDFSLILPMLREMTNGGVRRLERLSVRIEENQRKYGQTAAALEAAQAVNQLFEGLKQAEDRKRELSRQPEADGGAAGRD